MLAISAIFCRDHGVHTVTIAGLKLIVIPPAHSEAAKNAVFAYSIILSDDEKAEILRLQVAHKSCKSPSQKCQEVGFFMKNEIGTFNVE